MSKVKSWVLSTPRRIIGDGCARERGHSGSGNDIEGGILCMGSKVLVCRQPDEELGNVGTVYADFLGKNTQEASKMCPDLARKLHVHVAVKKEYVYYDGTFCTTETRGVLKRVSRNQETDTEIPIIVKPFFSPPFSRFIRLASLNRTPTLHIVPERQSITPRSRAQRLGMCQDFSNASISKRRKG